MKRCYLLFVTFLFVAGAATKGQSPANELALRVDLRVELLCIAFRIAGYAEVSDTLNPEYVHHIEQHFSKHKTHPLIKNLQTLLDSVQRNNIEFGYWDIPALAVHLKYPPDLSPMVSIDASPSEDIWDNRIWLTAQRVDLIRSFYFETQAQDFFNNQHLYYTRIEQILNQNQERINKSAIEKFFSQTAAEDYYAIIGLQLRNGAYLRVNRSGLPRQTFTVFSCNAFDEYGIPKSGDKLQTLRSVVHEFIHGFVNPAADTYENEWKDAAEKILKQPQVWERMAETFYNNPRYLIYESLVRAASIIYITRHHRHLTTRVNEIKAQEKSGFFWMGELIDVLDRYEKNRKPYRDFKSVMPEICRLFVSVADRMQEGNFKFNTP